jgi:hypothetical protein
VTAVAAESLAVKRQLLIVKPEQRRSPRLAPSDRLIRGVCALFDNRANEFPRRTFGSWAMPFSRTVEHLVHASHRLTISRDVLSALVVSCR